MVSKTLSLVGQFIRLVILTIAAKAGLILLAARGIHPDQWLAFQIDRATDPAIVETMSWGIAALIGLVLLVLWDWFRPFGRINASLSQSVTKRTTAEAAETQHSWLKDVRLFFKELRNWRTPQVASPKLLPEQRPANFEVWDIQDQFQVWQAACLLAGIEPFEVLAVTQGTQAYPYYMLLITAVRHRQLKLSREEAELRYSDIARADLVEWARQKTLRSRFLFPEQRTEIAPTPIMSDATVALIDFARRAYEATKDGVVGGAAAMGSNDDDILTWYAYYVWDKYPIFGEQPPSRLTERTKLRGYHFKIEDGQLLARASSGNRRWVNLTLKHTDAEAALTALRQMNAELG